MNYTYFNHCKGLISTCFTALFVAVICFLPWRAVAQDELPRHYKSYKLSIQNNGTQKKGNSYTISEPGATWLRLFFDNIKLGNASSVTITSDLDGASQTLNAATIKTWKSSSAYFNGNSVTVTLNTAANDKSASVDVVELGIGDPKPSTKSQCGPVDDRVDANDAAIGRIVPIGCTGWIITNGKFVTAGHCANSRAQILEFNVPKSSSNGGIVHPAPKDQYPIGSVVSGYVSGQPVTDWAVFTAGANTQTGLTAIQAQGKSFDVVQSAPGSSITITGFGVDNGSDNQTQQTHTGPLVSASSTLVRYQTETRGGNSGSPIIDAATGKAVGVHGYGGCTTSGTGSNFGVRATVAGFWDALGLDGNPPGGDCEPINFNDYQISSFSNQDVSGNYTINNGGRNLVLQNNTWKTIPFNYTVTSNTVIEFQFSSSSEGEIHAVGFEDNNSLSSSRYFKVYGTQSYGVRNYDNYGGSGTVTYTIPVGNFYTGNMSTLLFINDHDSGSGNNSTFSNVKVYEGSCGRAPAMVQRVNREAIVPVLGTQDERSLQEVVVGSNLAQNQFTIQLGTTGARATIHTLLGQPKGVLALKPGTNQVSAHALSLAPGIYLIKIERNNETITKRLVVR
ncbi:trypsin-like peptidase domain-containing protein [Microscilla marina]|uniref:Serine protease n=1 Tax=Microscilla marina ATCC 23134 TaxID=313606 RepID=A2A098_MICM2|nr:trypsin-like peptidase domain-containing protein [Microscilla marina]EAY23941.1 trypsin domain protein [Microscilla marina ATCC 23134]